MTTIELLQKSIDYIEENLTSEIILSEVARVTGFSYYHFYQLFTTYVGMPVAAYITNRRLHHAIYSIYCGNKSIDIALEYGFNTYAEFYKASKREFGCSPTKYIELNTVKKPLTVNLEKEAEFMLNQRQVAQLLSNWNIEKNLEIKNIYTADGEIKSNEIWAIGEKYILKTRKNISGIKTHIDISKKLEEEGISSSTPVMSVQGEDYIIKDDRFYILTNRIKGIFISLEERYGENRIEISKKYGEAIGNLHKVLMIYDKDIEVNDNNLLKTVREWALPETKIAMEQWGCPLPNEFYEDYLDNFTKMYAHLPRHIIHRDPNPSNIMFNNDEVSGFIDFDISERNVRIFDLCYCATGILSEANNIEDDYDKWTDILQGIIDGYNNIVNLTDMERRAIPYVIYSIQMIFIAWLPRNKTYKNLAIRNREMLQEIYLRMK